MTTSAPCTRPGCTGTVMATGFCGTCHRLPPAGPGTTGPASTRDPGTTGPASTRGPGTTGTAGPASTRAPRRDAGPRAGGG
ncbi:hypothetical protein M4914_12545, partial [Streptomyces somaliensis DSM 40738]|nr:hypothetical protein [Streptomyces somaliensis DSM 40738]